MSEEADSVLDQPLTFAEHKEQTATDLETIAAEFTKAAAAVREGNMKAFEAMFFGNEDFMEDTSKITKLRELAALRYCVREERVEKTKAGHDAAGTPT